MLVRVVLLEGGVIIGSFKRLLDIGYSCEELFFVIISVEFSFG